MDIRRGRDGEIYYIWGSKLVWGCTSKDQGKKPEGGTSHQLPAFAVRAWDTRACCKTSCSRRLRGDNRGGARRIAERYDLAAERHDLVTDGSNALSPHPRWC
jgi:hypothetical protein